MSLVSSRLRVNGIDVSTYNDLMFPTFRQNHLFQYFYKIICNFFSRIEFAAYTWRWPTDHYLIDRFSQGINNSSSLKKVEDVFQAVSSFYLKRACEQRLPSLIMKNHSLLFRITELSEQSEVRSLIGWNLSHLQREVVGVKIPQADPSINLAEWKNLFRRANLVGPIDNDGRPVFQWECKFVFDNSIDNLSAGAYHSEGLRPATHELIDKSVNILRHLLIFAQTADNNTLQNIIKRLTVCFFHCTDRLATELQDMWYDYIAQDQSNLRVEERTFDNCLFRWLYSRRISALQRACAFSEDPHPAATHRYYRKLLKDELGIADELAAAGADWEDFAKRYEEARVRREFYSDYDIFKITKQFSDSILDGTNKEVTFNMINQWFLDKGFSQSDFLVMDEDPGKIKIKIGAIFYLFREMNILSFTF